MRKSNPNTEIVSVGTELLLGHVTNTDARDISAMLSGMGINVKYHTVVGDNPARLEECIRIARKRADIIITTGGLGPTCDDLTKQITARAFGLELVTDEYEKSHMYDYIRRDRIPTENNLKQFELPEGCTVFHNDCGTAPGCAFEADGVLVIMIPGPPKECNAMFRDKVMPFLKERSDGEIVSHSVNIFGLSESKVDDIFAPEMNAMTNPTMAPYAKECDCLIQVTAKAPCYSEAEEMLRPVIAHIRETVGEYVYGIDVECLEEALAPLLKNGNITFSVADAMTGGDICRRFSSQKGAEEICPGGIAVNTDEGISRLLGIDPDVLMTEGRVSCEIAAEMAENVRLMFQTGIGVGITGAVEADAGAGIEAGAAFIAVATENETFIKELSLGEHRTGSFLRHMAGNHVFDMLRRYVCGLNVI